MIRNAVSKDARVIAEIYNHYVLGSPITFEEDPVSGEIIRSRIINVQKTGLPWIVSEIDSNVVGYAYATKWKDRSAYRFSVETTIYLSQNMHGSGLPLCQHSCILSCLKNSKNVECV